ncbi:thiol-disulfide isomerase/thioredoxin [Desulfobaculum xiamenense]|uniref:Thiol-disulfide isomerase/thioredoxin n=1 Tax=Desulfobaculum xiamenense TaxID=995050 RepID=A0A846QT48_9BACT|nr:TlpA disulfide reductase family protein [Desulfobaculum xiamenense]NJB67819.1 thiol-disulfide isomerase/thioredoxin [Desulfobaculum xiamenense]
MAKKDAGVSFGLWWRAAVPVALVLLVACMPWSARGEYLGTIDARGIERLIAQAQGRAVVVSFFATWCSPCREETPEFIALRDEVSHEDLLFVGVSLDFDEEALTGYVRSEGVNYPVYLAEPGVAAHFGVEGIPALLIWDAEGTLRSAQAGYLPREEMRALVMRYIGRGADVSQGRSRTASGG